MSLTYPEDRSYHSEHLWAKAEPDGTMLVGITDYAQAVSYTHLTLPTILLV